ncbi:DUF11 domain-containing protein [Actinomadura macrotermitis]|uniref:DUF11 domain-containing protein n=1 Tax=Actinomadura macrotermitis TaxID=2585200 RepID=A0A7K0BQ05_9ACTN|nr:DUF11 domain-containing protein [Actinomadura macrotermitis]MQY03255.1 hypothetical protein [Actinomadura macrotermitis]
MAILGIRSYRACAVLLAMILAFAWAGITPAWAYPGMSVTVTPSSVAPGDTFTITASGTADASYTNVRIGFYKTGGGGLDEITSISNCPTTCTELAGLGYFVSVGNLAPGAPFSASITLQVDPGTPPQSFAVRYQFLTSGQGNAGTQQGPPLSIVAPPADIAVGLTASPKLGILVPNLLYTLTARNTGPGAVTSAALTATLPPGATATDLASGCTTAGATVTCDYGAIANGAAVDKTFRVPLSLLSAGKVTVTGVRTTSAPTDPNAANDTASASCNVTSILLVSCP